MAADVEKSELSSNWYLNDQLEFDKQLIRFRYDAIKSNFVGCSGLELGSAEGVMTELLVNDFESLTIVDGSSELLSKIPEYNNVIKVHSLFEKFEPDEKFDSIIMEHVLEHIDDPVILLERVKKWLAPGGKVFIGVPNGNSIHGLVAVKMGLLEYSHQLNERDILLGHRRVYLPDTLKYDIETSGMSVEFMGGVYFKPLSNKQIQDNWDEAMIQGFYELGKDFPEYAAEIYAVCIPQ